ncbi:snRNA-activating protein of 50kDa MW C terminal-domain-containing protein [Phakopsora pachyrhizi]|uniref:snRNA-activating protein of 50kDa MW C terminal-domain-containing protein n=1 Tax=Phakopsora pachyrhizi TaxID=170000 RepID=A0AAV0AQY7_PHAPC|nr:snRNA-activating protein of 50kDa MW C terminal-domain-containing protein [Phakopsora pachyrhizi]CAH7669942.1 snRNA-activating protein of 50kDa MW C terminal-domain-containing protein [Phakopsora pachyrhizi]
MSSPIIKTKQPPPKPSRALLKNQAKALESFLPSSDIISIERFITQSNEFNKKFKNELNQKITAGSSSVQKACQLGDLIYPLDSIYKDSNLLSELKDHQHELATPYGSLHAIHLSDQSANDDPQQSSSSLKRNRTFDDETSKPADIPVNPSFRPAHSSNKTQHLDPSLWESSPDVNSNEISNFNQNIKPKRIRKKASGPRQALNHKPKPIQDLINKLASTGLKTLESSYDGMYYVKSIGKSDWNTSSQPIFSNLTISNDRDQDKFLEPVILTVTFHPFSKTTENEFKALAPRKQTIHILSDQTLSDLKDAMVCAADRIPRSLDDSKWSPDRWISGSVIEIENILFGDHRDLSSDKSDYALMIHEVAPKITKREIEPIYSNPLMCSDNQVGSSVPHQDDPKLRVSKFGMESVRFDQLNLRVGEPYWLLHQGNCEHLFTIDEIRAIHPTDPKPSKKINPYPITTFLSRLNSLKCRVCDRDPASLITLEDEMVSESPCYLCLTCFKILHGHELRKSSLSKQAKEINRDSQVDPIVTDDDGNNDKGREDEKDDIEIEWGKVYHRTWWAVPILGST